MFGLLSFLKWFYGFIQLILASLYTDLVIFSFLFQSCFLKLKIEFVRIFLAYSPLYENLLHSIFYP